MREIKEVKIVGGPSTFLPYVVESFCCWMVALTLLSVSGYHYIRTMLAQPLIHRVKKKLRLKKKDDDFLLELTTSSRSEQRKLSRHKRFQQLIDYLQQTTNCSSWSDEELVKIIRQSEIARRLTSLIMSTSTTLGESRTNSVSSFSTMPKQYKELGQKLKKIWPRLLALPSPKSSTDHRYEISIIMPAYNESGYNIQRILELSLETCMKPERVEIILVDAGKNKDLNIISNKNWGSLQIIPFSMGGGRGPCLNYGAQLAKGRIFSFLHSDSILPPNWDCQLLNTLDNNKLVRVTLCCFSFGIDLSLKGLNGGGLPPGIKAVETTANWRSCLYSLPYGDQVLSLHAVIFHYIGGFPDQCMMEDYELTSLLRRRASFIKSEKREKIKIIGGIPVFCSPRRWQKRGVLYVTFTNSRLVNLYAKNEKTPDEIFQQYYGFSPPQRSDAFSPWESEMKKDLPGKEEKWKNS